MEIRKCNFEGEGAGGASLVYNSGELETMSSDIGTQKGALETKIGEMFDIIDKGFANIWSGPSYNAFKTFCDNYRTGTINPMIEALGDFGGKVGSISEVTSTTSREVSGLFQG